MTRSDSDSWLDFAVDQEKWLLGCAGWPEPGWPPANASVAGNGIGLGTGGFRPEVKAQAIEAIEVARGALRAGLRVIDTSTNYGSGFAEVVVGAAIRHLVDQGEVVRRDVFVVSKSGYVAHPPNESAAHSVKPDFVRAELAASRRRLGLETIDAYLLHNPEEQLAVGGKGWRDIRDALAALEAAAQERLIGGYGVSAAEGFLTGTKGFHSLQSLLRCAKEVGGSSHHFRLVELPVSLWRREAFTATPYRLRRERANTLQVAADAGLLVLGSMPIGRGRGNPQAVEFLKTIVPDSGIESAAMLALQFVRSIPGVHLALVGMSTRAHLQEVAALALKPRWDLSRIASPTSTSART